MSNDTKQEKSKQYYEDNKELIREKGKLYREKYKEEIKERKRIAYEVNKELIKEKRKSYRAENKELIKETRRKHREKNKEHIKNRTLIKTYGIDIKEYNNMKEQQEHVCYICKGERKLVVDHCHTSGKTRRLLCNHCNLALGLVNENKEILQAMIDYLFKTV